MPISQWLNANQTSQKPLNNGENHSTDAELLAIILHTGNRNLAALDMANTLLAQYGGLKNLIDHLSHLSAQGVTTASQIALQAAIELGRRYLATPLHKGQKLNHSRIIKHFFMHQLGQQPREIFACLYLNNHFQLLAYEPLFQGTVNQANIHPREILRLGLRCNAVNVVLAHNHPSGSPTPSKADQEVTTLIQQALALVDMTVIDHIIVAGNACYSFAEHNLLNEL